MILAGAPNPAEVSNDHFAVIVTGIVAVLVALCTLGGIVLPLLIKARNAAAAANEQVSNNHVRADGTPINLRDEQDERHGQNVGVLVEIRRDVKAILQTLAVHGYRLDQHHDAIEELEHHTLDRRPER
ncbi:hypothetical protein [Curtobacterium flaccumfaciens]|uniref:hypothetical protein n=1 Tax=Curtobacterium flaccumfaciens TaxID=2035 RepID=UPI001BDE3DDB|nr:hypothetical protein [Curtobacterium flaccumfaciens]MBT1633758.1 hypothetical protein [Curtobacterium flaccumfaciens pv. oortii]MCX2845562.1 hypothetical protein [Curtobacterium flaccumfaciens pv. oortii]